MGRTKYLTIKLISIKKMPSSCLCIIIHIVIESFGLGEKIEIINLRTKMFLNFFIM